MFPEKLQDHIINHNKVENTDEKNSRCEPEIVTALAANEELIRMLADTAPIMIWMTGADTICNYFNSVWLEFTGRSHLQELGNGWLEGVHPEDRQQVQHDYVIALKKYQKFQREYRLRRADGEYRWIVDNVSPRFTADGNFLGYIGYAVDINDIKIKSITVLKNEARLRLALHTAEMGVWDWNIRTGKVTCSEQLEQIFACTTGYVGTSYKAFLKCIHPQDRSIVTFAMKNCLQAKTSYDVEFRIILQDGTVRWVRGKGDVLRDYLGKPVRMMGTAIDITKHKKVELTLEIAKQDLEIRVEERTNKLKLALASFREVNAKLKKEIAQSKQAEEALQASYSLLHSVIDSTPDLIFVKDLQGRYVMLNSSFAQFFKKPIQEIIGKDDTNFFSPEIVSQIKNIDHKVITTGGAETFEEILPQKDINYTCLTTKSPWRDSQGNIIGLIGITRNISDRKRMESALRESEAQYKELACTAQEKAQQLEAALSELKATQTQLIQTEKMSSLGQLVAGIAHEINNPVNFIHGNINHASEYAQELLNLVELYQQYYPHPALEIEEQIEAIDLEFISQDLPKLLASMKMGTDRIRQIVLSLRNFSRLDEADMKAVDIHEGIDNTLLLLQNRLKAKPECPEIQVIKEYGDLPLVECYVGQLNQVFMNLLTNAIDALEEEIEKRGQGTGYKGQQTETKNKEILLPNSQSPIPNPQSLIPQIRIYTDIKEDLVMIHIADNGPGIPEEVRQKLFDPFFTTKAIGKGTGMGLSISYKIIVEKHLGNLQCISTPGQGAEFVVTIPLRQAKF